jgi:hypothetical protein
MRERQVELDDQLRVVKERRVATESDVEALETQLAEEDVRLDAVLQQLEASLQREEEVLARLMQQKNALSAGLASPSHSLRK